MPNKDWYWNRFDADLIGDKLDLSDDKTSALGEKGIEGRQDYDDTTRVQYETQWIDQLYGTEGRKWATNQGEDLSKLDSHKEGPEQWMYSTDSWQVNDSILEGSAAGWSPLWGLDLVRDWTGKEDLKVGTDEHFHWQTRGKVAWDHYYDDNAYQKAWAEYRKDHMDGKFQSVDLEKLLTSTSDSEVSSAAGKVNFIDWAEDEYSGKAAVDDDEALPTEWDNEYVDQFDPETAKPYEATYLDVPDLWGQAERRSDWAKPITPIEVVKPASLPTLDSIKRRQVTVPDSIKHFGEAKSAPTEKFTAGGN